MSMKNGQLFIDFDGTLCHDKFWKSAGVDVRSNIQEYLFQKNKDVVQQWMLGQYRSEDVNAILADFLRIPFSKLWKIFVEDCRKMEVSKSVLKRIGRLREQYKIILLTDNMDSFSRFTIPALRLDSYFDEIINSYDEKKSKKELLPKLIESADRNFLIDDSRTACDIFENLGGTAFLVTPGQNINVRLDLLATLKNH